MPRRAKYKFSSKDGYFTVFFNRGKKAGRTLGQGSSSFFWYNPPSRPAQGPITRTGLKPVTGLEGWMRRRM